MEADVRRRKLDLAWAAAFLTTVIAVFLVGLFAFAWRDDVTIWMAVLLFVGGALSVLDVVVLLTLPGHAPGLLSIGRILVWLSFLCVAMACVLGIVSVSR